MSNSPDKVVKTLGPRLGLRKPEKSKIFRTPFKDVSQNVESPENVTPLKPRILPKLSLSRFKPAQLSSSSEAYGAKRSSSEDIEIVSPSSSKVSKFDKVINGDINVSVNSVEGSSFDIQRRNSDSKFPSPHDESSNSFTRNLASVGTGVVGSSITNTEELSNPFRDNGCKSSITVANEDRSIKEAEAEDSIGEFLQLPTSTSTSPEKSKSQEK